jgi:CHASE3 domain sensor protein
MRLLLGIAALTIFCMFAVALVIDRLADISLSASPFGESSHVHLIDNVTSALKRAQESRAAYLATGNSAYLDAYQSASSDVDFSMNLLVHEDEEVTQKLAHAQGLLQLVHTKLAEIGHGLESKAAPAAAAATPAIDNDLTRIQKLLNSLAQEESSDVSGQIAAARVRTQFHRNLEIALGVINVLFLGGVLFCAFQIRKLHSLVTMCAWSKRVQYKGQWIPLEEYIKNRFGVRISHGISKEEYEKWGVSGPAEPSAETSEAKTEAPRESKAVA